MSLADYLENSVINWLRGTAMPAAPATLYVALFTVAPTDLAGSGTEVSGGAYARTGVTLAAPPASSAGAAVVSNTTQVAFATATAAWGTVVAAALMDAATAGNMLASGALTTALAVGSGQRLVFDVGQLSFSLD